MRDGYGRTLKKHRTLPNQCRNYRQEKEEKMTEEERTQAKSDWSAGCRSWTHKDFLEGVLVLELKKICAGR